MASDEGSFEPHPDLATPSAFVEAAPRVSWRAKLLAVSARDFAKFSVIVAFSIVALVLFVLALVPASPVQAGILDFLVWVESLPFLVSAALVVLGYTSASLLVAYLRFSSYSTSLLLFLPGSPWNLAAGYLFGVWEGKLGAWNLLNALAGSVIAIVGAMIGATSAFLLGRGLLREWALRLLRTRPTMRYRYRRTISLAYLSPVPLAYRFESC